MTLKCQDYYIKQDFKGDDELYIPGIVQDTPLTQLIDTGSCVTIISVETVQQIRIPKDPLLNLPQFIWLQQMGH